MPAIMREGAPCRALFKRRDANGFAQTTLHSPAPPTVRICLAPCAGRLHRLASRSLCVRYASIDSFRVGRFRLPFPPAVSMPVVSMSIQPCPLRKATASIAAAHAHRSFVILVTYFLRLLMRRLFRHIFKCNSFALSSNAPVAPRLCRHLAHDSLLSVPKSKWQHQLKCAATPAACLFARAHAPNTAPLARLFCNGAGNWVQRLNA